MKKEEALYLAKCCLPKLLIGDNTRDNTDDDDNDNSSSSNKKNSEQQQQDDDDVRIKLLSTKDVTLTRVCGLWGGMGSIYRLSIACSSSSSSSGLQKKKKCSPRNTTTTTTTNHNIMFDIAVKHIPPPLAFPDPSSMSTGDCRKATAYQVEANFYQNVAPKLLLYNSRHCHCHHFNVPRLYHLERRENKSLTMCISWVDTASSCLDDCYNNNDLPSIHATLQWLATLHAAFWKAPVEWFSQQGVHTVGSYWHLDTRKEEHANMPRRGWEGRLKHAARAIDECLKRDSYQCFIHGDVKGANILVGAVHAANNQGDSEGNDALLLPQVTLCDYQYCGRGPPTRDLAYFFASTLDLDDDNNNNNENELLEYYHQNLIQQLSAASQEAPDLSHLKDSLDLAYCDFCRFQSGWGYWGAPLRKRVEAVLTKLDNGKDLMSEEAYDRAIRHIYW